jgi:O-antigen/teichoic acid export membrane protein
LILILAINLVAPWFVPLVFGTRWSGAVTCLQIISPMVLMGFAAAPTGSTPEALQRQDLHLIREAFRSVIMVLALSIAYLLRAKWFAALGVISAAGVINYAFYLWISWFAIRSYIRKPPAFGEPVVSGA